MALRTRDELLHVLTSEPDRTGWFLVIDAMVPVLDRPADQAVTDAAGVQHPAVGPVVWRLDRLGR